MITQISFIEISSVCNLTCSYCPHPTMGRHKQFMTLDTFKKSLKLALSLGPNADNTVSLHDFGEVLLHPHLEDIFKLCQESGVKPAFATNVKLLKGDDRKKYLDLILKYEAHVEISEHLFSNPTECIEFVDDLKNKGVDAYPGTATMVAIERGGNTTQGFYHHNWLAGKKINSFDEVHKKCYYLANNVVGILSDGSIVSCCADAEGNSTIANVNDPGFDLAKQHLDNFPWEGCKSCTLFKTYWDDVSDNSNDIFLDFEKKLASFTETAVIEVPPYLDTTEAMLAFKRFQIKAQHLKGKSFLCKKDITGDGWYNRTKTLDIEKTNNSESFTSDDIYNYFWDEGILTHGLDFRADGVKTDSLVCYKGDNFFSFLDHSFTSPPNVSHGKMKRELKNKFVCAINQEPFEDFIKNFGTDRERYQKGNVWWPLIKEKLTWISPKIEKIYSELYSQGKVITASAYHNNELVGGAIGFKKGDAIALNSMFSTVSGSSHAAMIYLIDLFPTVIMDIENNDSENHPYGQFGTVKSSIGSMHTRLNGQSKTISILVYLKNLSSARATLDKLAEFKQKLPNHTCEILVFGNRFEKGYEAILAPHIENIDYLEKSKDNVTEVSAYRLLLQKATGDYQLDFRLEVDTLLEEISELIK